MGISKYTLWKYVRVDGTWRYCKAAYHENGKIRPDIVFVNVKEGLLEKHPEGRYYMSHTAAGSTPPPTRWGRSGSASSGSRSKNTTASAGKDLRKALSFYQTAQAERPWQWLPRNTLRIAKPEVLIPRAFASLEHCGVTYVDECRDNKQVLFNYMRWLRKQPVPERKYGNPERTLANKVEDVRIFLKTFGITKLLTKYEEPKYHEKKIVAHPGR